MMYVLSVFISCIVLLSSVVCCAQQHSAFGRVLNEQGEPVARCMVRAAYTQHAVQCNERGEFNIAYDADKSKSLVFSCMGYDTRELNVTADSMIVILHHRINELKEAIVEAEPGTGKKHMGVLGKKNLKQSAVCSDIAGSEVAIFLWSNGLKRSKLQEIYFYITKDGIPNADFRVHIYALDTNYLPGKDLLDSNLVLHATKGDEWVRTDIGELNVPVGKGVFISMEWLSGSGDNPNVVTSKKDLADVHYNAQVLGMTGGYSKGGSLTFNRSRKYPEWECWDNYPERFEEHLNPMIYATYSFWKK